jgi:hypothetical protein
MSSTPARSVLSDLSPDLRALVLGALFRDHLDDAIATPEAQLLSRVLEKWLMTFVRPDA